MLKKSKVTNGVYWVEVPDADLRVLCGCPADTVKHLMRRGYIAPTERHGVTFESGPNVVLLSDISIQNGDFANLAEFPVLQMLYRQGMLLPKHPNNTGRKPIILGNKYQIEAQKEYIFRGNYGLCTLEELLAVGTPRALAEEYMRLKTRFAFGKIRASEELVDFRVIEDQPVEIVPGVAIERVAINTYRISHSGDYEEVSLNLPSHQNYECPYVLGQHKIKREYFSVVHTGEGDGWDINRPCMASIVVFQGRVYLIDAGPNVIHTLNSLGISVNEIAGIFHTHAHDDHFAGLTSLVRADRRLPYFATPLVRAAVMKKLGALMSFPEEQFGEFFVPHNLVPNEWNMIEGLEVKPVFSPHPVETTVLFFRALWQDGYKTYAHLADVASFATLDALAEGGTKFSGRLVKEVKAHYLTPVDIKKVDVGGGMIHGDAADFQGDASARIVLSHRSTPLTLAEKEIGADTFFGMQDVLIKSTDGSFSENVTELLRQSFAAAPDHDLQMLANCRSRTLSIGSILLKKNAPIEAVYLLLNGLIEVLDIANLTHNTLTPGSLIGERGALSTGRSARTYRAASFIRVLEIPVGMYREFVERNDLAPSMQEYLERKHFLEGTYLFGDRISGSVINGIAQEMVRAELSSAMPMGFETYLYLIESGNVDVLCRNKTVFTAGPGEVFGAHHVLGPGPYPLTFRSRTSSTAYAIPVEVIRQIPIVRWKLLEQLSRRMQTCSAIFQD